MKTYNVTYTIEMSFTEEEVDEFMGDEFDGDAEDAIELMSAAQFESTYYKPEITIVEHNE